MNETVPPPKGLPTRIKQQEGHQTQFVLTGFSHDAGVRVFTFERIAADHTRSHYSVSADMALTRSHGIPVQELPLLCLRFLEQHGACGEARNLTFSEDSMRVYADNLAAEREAAQRKRSARRPPPNVGTRTEGPFPEKQS